MSEEIIGSDALTDEALDAVAGGSAGIAVKSLTTAQIAAMLLRPVSGTTAHTIDNRIDPPAPAPAPTPAPAPAAPTTLRAALARSGPGPSTRTSPNSM